MDVEFVGNNIQPKSEEGQQAGGWCVPIPMPFFHTPTFDAVRCGDCPPGRSAIDHSRFRSASRPPQTGGKNLRPGEPGGQNECPSPFEFWDQNRTKGTLSRACGTLKEVRNTG